MRAALGFLTVLPVSSPVAGSERRVLLAFPVVGVSVGMVWAGTAWLAGFGLPLLVVAALVVAADVAVTGALHLDAVGDVGDGYAARRSGGDAIVAMTDSRLGAVGAATLVATLLVRFALLAALVVAPWTAALWLAPIVGRAGMAVSLWASPSRDGSVAGDLSAAATTPVVGLVVAATAGLGAAAVLAGAPAHLVAIAVVGGLAVSLLVTRRGIVSLGRPSGDLVGAAGIAAETFALLALAWTG